MQKEILTMEKIKQDHKNRYLTNKKSIWIGLAISVISLIVLLVMMVDSLNSKAGSIIDRLPLMILCVFCVYVGIVGLFRLNRDNIYISHGKIKIATDRLIGSVEGATYYSNPVAAISSKPYSLEFASYGKYPIGRSNNTFSDEYQMSDAGVYLSSRIGETFYLVLSRKEKILLAYNTKFFELQI